MEMIRSWRGRMRRSLFVLLSHQPQHSINLNPAISFLFKIKFKPPISTLVQSSRFHSIQALGARLPSCNLPHRSSKMSDPDSTPDFVTLSRLLKQLDHADNKRLIAARDKFDLNQLSSSSQTTSSNPNLELESPLAFNIDHALMTENDGKNRYTDIVSYDEALLPSPYLNASLIPCPTSTSTSTSTLPSYISTQAPLPSTFPTFFHHLISQRVTLILMLTPLVESGRRKAQQYWPDPNEKIRDLGQGWRIELISESVERDQEKDWECFFRKLKVFSSEGGDVGYEFDQIHVTSWADHGASSQESLKRILDLMDHYSSTSNSGTQSNGNHSISNNNPSPILVHCSAGVGRSGTVISSHILRHLSRSKIHISTSSIQSYLSISNRNRNGKDVVEDGDEDFKLKKYSDQDPYLIVKFIRFFRPRMVQTPAQLEMVWNHWKEEERINSIRK